MAIALELETRDQKYKIYGGSTGFIKIFEAAGLVRDNLLTTGKILEVLSDLDHRKAIISVLLEEGEFEPSPDVSTKPKKEEFISKLAKQLDIGWTIKLIARLTNELSEATSELSAITPAIATQE
jgi:hypothetical protein